MTDKIGDMRPLPHGISERIGRIREGFQSQCPNCGCFINFSDESLDVDIARVMREVRRIRNGLVPAGSGTP
jgi:hypothetical protein